MRIAVFNSKSYDQDTLNLANSKFQYEFVHFDDHLNRRTVMLASGFDVVCVFVNDHLDKKTVEELAKLGVKHIALRCAGFNAVDIQTAQKLGITVSRVPAYSPEAVAEHVFALLLTLVRKTHRAYNRVREANFSLEGLCGINLHGRTFGVIGAGKIGQAAIRIAVGFGMKVLTYDTKPELAKKQSLQCQFVDLDTLFHQADIISLHTPLLPETHHMIDAASLAKMKPGVVLINTSRGGLINTPDLIKHLKSGHVSGVGMDVYEYEEAIFSKDLSDTALQDDLLARLLMFHNVIITSHQGYLTNEALNNIAHTVLENIHAHAQGQPIPNAVLPAVT